MHHQGKRSGVATNMEKSENYKTEHNVCFIKKDRNKKKIGTPKQTFFIQQSPPIHSTQNSLIKSPRQARS